MQVVLAWHGHATGPVKWPLYRPGQNTNLLTCQSADMLCSSKASADLLK